MMLIVDQSITSSSDQHRTSWRSLWLSHTINTELV